MLEFEIPAGNEFLNQEMDYESLLSFLDEALIMQVDPNQTDTLGLEPVDSLKGAARLGDKIYSANIYVVQPGDTYSSIAINRGVTIEQLRTWNGYGDKSIPVGAVLIVSEPTLRTQGGLVVADRAARAVFDESGRKNAMPIDNYRNKIFNKVLDQLGPLAGTLRDVDKVSTWAMGQLATLRQAFIIWDGPNVKGEYDKMVNASVDESLPMDVQADLVWSRNASIEDGMSFLSLVADIYTTLLAANLEGIISASSLSSSKSFKYTRKYSGGGGTSFNINDPWTFRGQNPADVAKYLKNNGWTGTATNPNKVYTGGMRYTNNIRGEQIRIMPGGSTRSMKWKQGPYMEISRGGKKTIVPLKGNPVL